MFDGCARTGLLWHWPTVIMNALLSVTAPSLTLTVAEKVPKGSVIPGARWIFPVPVPLPGLIVVTVMNVGPDAFANVSGCASGSVAVIGWSAVVPWETVMF